LCGAVLKVHLLYSHVKWETLRVLKLTPFDKKKAGYDLLSALGHSILAK